jgi:hypothetical protein
MVWFCSMYGAQGNALVKGDQTALVADGQAEQIKVSDLSGAVNVRVPEYLAVQQADVVAP